MEWAHTSTLWWPLLLAIALALSYLRATWWQWTAVAVLVLPTFTVVADASLAARIGLWIVFLLPLCATRIPWLREQLIGRPVRALYSRSLSHFTAQVGGVGWEAELFRGRPRWRDLLAEAHLRLTEAERAFLAGPAAQLCLLLEAHRADRELPDDVWDHLRKEGFFGLAIAREHGGRGFSAYGIAQIVQQIASRSAAAALVVAGPNTAGAARFIADYGTDAQRVSWLPQLASGSVIPCLAVPEPASRRSAAVPGHGVVRRKELNGVQTTGLQLSLDAPFTPYAPVADLVCAALRVEDPDGLLDFEPADGLTLMLVPGDTPGLDVGRRYAIGSGVPLGPVRGRFFVPLDAVVGGPERIGDGWRMLLETRADARGVAFPAVATGVAKLACRTAGAYARLEHVYRRPPGELGAVRVPLARLAAYTYCMDAARHVALGAVEAGHRPAVVSAIVEYSLAERSRTVVNDALDVHGRSVLCTGACGLLSGLQTFPALAQVTESSSLLTRSLITYGQGLMRCHPYLGRELAALQDEPPQGAETFNRLFVSHVGFTLSNLVRTLALACFGGRLARAPWRVGTLRRYFRALSRMNAAFAFVTDVLVFTLRDELRTNEAVTGRMASILSEQYLAAATLKHVVTRKHMASDQPLAEWVLHDCLVRVRRHFEALFMNFPRPWLGAILRRIVFPFGRPYRAARDELTRSVSDVLLAPSSVRDRLTEGVFVPPGSDDELAALEDAFTRVCATAHLRRKLEAATTVRLVSGDSVTEQIPSAVEARVLTEEEGRVLQEAEESRNRALRVDELLL